MWKVDAVSWIFYLKFVSDSPYGGNGPVRIVFDLFTKTFDMNVYSTAGITDVFITPDVIQKLFNG